MSCNRYHLWAALDVHAFSKAEAVLRFSAEEDGMWVQWQDYARLKAEVERLRASSFVTAVPVEQYERVIKAGDDVFCIACNAPSSEGRQKILQAWQAAKEGKPSV